MRAVVQRVKSARILVDQKTIGEINQGLLVFLGIEHADGRDDILWLASKISALRVFDDADSVMNISVCDSHNEVLIISQFTLHASTKKGNRPSYIRAARPEVSEPLYLEFIQEMKRVSGRKVEGGEFGAHMEVELVNDGPVTILLDSKNKE